MSERYDTITTYSMHLIDEGDIIYYLVSCIEPDILCEEGHVVAKPKGRLGIVIKKPKEHFSVARMYELE